MLKRFSPLDRPRTAIVGTGGIARAHAMAATALADRLDLVAAVEVDPERLASFQEAHGVRAGYADVHEMLAREQPDVVQICTPPGSHVELSIACLEAGAWVLCEKPLAGSLADLDRIHAAEERTGRYVSSVAQWRFGSGGQHLRGLIGSEAMGRLLVGVCNTLWYRPASYYAVPWRGHWDTELGGVSMCLGIHIMDLLLYLLGDWTDMRGLMDTVEREIEDENVSMAIVRFGNGAMVSVTNSAVSSREESYLRLDFSRATVELSTLYGYGNANWRYSLASDATDAERQAFETWQTLPTETPTSQTSQLRALLDDMQTGRRPLVSGPEVRRTIEFLTSLYKSACTGEPVTRGSIQSGDPFYQGMAHVLVPQGA
jgi:predicted dehydrogenase